MLHAFLEVTSLPSQVSHVIIYSVISRGQNKNSHAAAMFIIPLPNYTNLKTVDHKFLISENTHLECDVNHYLLKKKKRSFKYRYHIHMICIT